MPSRVIDTMPSTMKLMMTIVAKTGRLIEVSDIHINEPRSAGLKTGRYKCLLAIASGY